MRKKLKVRITIWYTLFMLLLTAIFLLLLFVGSNINTEEQIQSDLINTVETVAQQIDGTKQVDLRSLLDQAIDDQIVAIYSENGSLLAGEEPSGMESLISFDNAVISSVIADGSVFYVYDIQVETSSEFLAEEDQREPIGSYLWVRGFVKMQSVQEIQRNYLLFGIALIPLLALIMIGGGYILTKRALRPLDDMIAETSAIVSADDLGRRISVPDSGDELSELGNSMNHMLSKLENSFARERQFTSDVSHELRTPIAVILSQCETIYSAPDMEQEEMLKGIQRIDRQGRRMKQLVEELLQISRIESGRVKPEWKEVNLSEMVSELVEEQQIIHPGEDTIETDIEDAISVMCDYRLTERAFRNLITNAHQYGNGFYRIVLQKQEKGILFSVTDRGEGIAQAEQKKIWDRFYKGDKSRTFQGGYGLGLPMVKNIVSLHGWNIQLHSSRGKGSEFAIYIPIK